MTSTKPTPAYRLFVWDACECGQEVGGVTHAQGDAQRALVAGGSWRGGFARTDAPTHPPVR
jgi:hypothetical protein